MPALPLIIGGIVFIAIGVATWKSPRLTSVILWALLAAIFTTCMLLMHLPGSFSEKALWMTLAVPLIWCGLQFWCYWDGKAWRVTGGLIALTVVGAAVTFLTTPSGLSDPSIFAETDAQTVEEPS
ncbi:MAG: hypothetical protein AAFP97_05300 [Pseudomonadota bacterium]